MASQIKIVQAKSLGELEANVNLLLKDLPDQGLEMDYFGNVETLVVKDETIFFYVVECHEIE